MARFFFHTRNGASRRDETGTELPDRGAAEQAAVVLLGELLQDAPKDFLTARGLVVTVADEGGAELFHLRLSVNG